MLEMPRGADRLCWSRKTRDDVSKMLQTEFHRAQLHLDRGLWQRSRSPRASGRVCLVPAPNTAHFQHRNASKALSLVMNTPGGFERMFELSPATPEHAVQALTAFG